MTERQWKTVVVAEKVMLSQQRDLWAVADAVLADVADDYGHGGDRSSSAGPTCSDQLAALTLALADAGIVRPDGAPYQISYLRDQRLTAMAWQPIDRQKETSFASHYAYRDGRGRVALLALCAVARGEKVDRPDELDAKAWRDALAKLKTRRHGFLVQASAIATALGMAAKNTPTVLDGATFAELCSHLLRGVEGLDAFEQKAADYDLDDDDRTKFVGILRKLIARATRCLDFVGAKITDDDLAAFLASESES